MRLKIFVIICFLFFFIEQNIFCSIKYLDDIDFFNIDFETGIEEQEDNNISTINNFYTFYKSNISFGEFNSIFKHSFKIINTLKNYDDLQKDNRSNQIFLNLQSPIYKAISFDFNVGVNYVTYDKNKTNNYTASKLNLKLIYSMIDFDIWTDLEYGEKNYGPNDSTNKSFSYNDYSNTPNDRIFNTNLSIGITKLVSEFSHLTLSCGIKKINQNYNEVKSNKNNQYAKVSYSWKR